MSTIVELVSSTPVNGGLDDGYRRSQLGRPSGTVGQPPKFRGETNKPGDDVKAPRVLSSAARHNRATNVTIPYARVTTADELCDKGRLSPGDLAFISRYQYGTTSQVRMNQKQKAQIVTSASTPHADVSRLAGLDYINRMLQNYHPNSTVLVDSVNPLDDWRKLTFLNEWTVDGIVMSNDSPGYVLSTSAGSRSDQLFNMCIQGPTQVNNGYEDDAGRGIASHPNRHSIMSAGFLRTKQPESSMIPSLIAGPFYSMYPLQMFDRKIRPLSDLYVGLICRKLSNGDADFSDLDAASGGKFSSAKHIHIFQYVCFSSRQVYQFATKGDDPTADDPDYDIVDTGIRSGRPGQATDEYYLGDSEPADRRRGPNDPKRGRTDNFLPRKRTSDHYSKSDTFLGIKREELLHMVGAWRIGKVLDVASQRMEGYTGGPIDTAFKVTLNTDISFLDWRQLRRNFTMNIFGWKLDIYTGGPPPPLPQTQHHWEAYNPVTQRFDNDYGRVMQWPTWYDLDNVNPRSAEDNIPIDPSFEGTGYNYGTRFNWLTDPALQRARYASTISYLNADLAYGAPGGPLPSIGSAAGGSTQAQQPTVSQERVPPLQAPLPSAGMLSFSEQVPEQATDPSREPQPTAPVQTPKGKEKAIPSVSDAAIAATAAPSALPTDPVRETPPPTSKDAAKAVPVRPKAAPKAAPKATVAAIGDDVMVKIFGSANSSSADVGAACAASGSSVAADRPDASSVPKEQPRSFPRRRDR